MALNWKLRGFDYVSYYNGAYENDDSLPALANTGANAIETSMEWGINPLTNTVYADPNYSDSLSAEGAVIRQAVAEGLQVLVKPHLDFLNPAYLKGTPYSVGDWRTYYNPGPAGSAGANSFFASYKTVLLQEAQVAAANGATMLSIGTELDQLCGPSYKSYWDDIISSIRKLYPSLKLTYAADWNDAVSPWKWGGSGLPAGTGNLATQISFASELDYLGLDVYAPLSNAANPTLAQLVAGWTQTPIDSGATAETYAVTGNQSLIQYFESVAAQVGKPLLFTEVGYENASDAASSPAGSATNAENDALQAEAYQALFQAYSQSGDTAVTGAFLYNWDPNAFEVGPGSVAFSPQNLPALKVVDAAFAAPALSAPASLGSGLDIVEAAPGVALGAGSTGSVFTVKLSVGAGLLFATGAGVAGSGGASVTISGTLAAVNAALATLQYEATSAANDAIRISASADGGPVGSATIAVIYDAAFPTPQFVAASPVSGATIDLSGSVAAADAGGTATYFVNGAASATVKVAAGGGFDSQLTLPTGEIDVVTAVVTDPAGNAGSTPPLLVGVSDGLTANFTATQNVVDLYNATSTGDVVNGSNGYVIVYGSKVTVNGGGDQIYTDSSPTDALVLTGTNGAADFVSGWSTSVELDNAQATIQGGSDPITVATGTANALTASGFKIGVRANVSLKLSGANDTVTLASGASLTLAGAGDKVAIGHNDRVTDSGAGALFKIDSSVGTLHIAGFAADKTGVIDLLGGVGGYASAAAASAAIQSDGAGGALLTLGAAGAIDFDGTSPAALGAARFRIG